MSHKIVDNCGFVNSFVLFQPASASCDIEEEFSFGFEILQHILLNNVKKALDAFRKNRVAILQKALNESGPYAVLEIEIQFNELDQFLNDIVTEHVNKNKYYKKLFFASNEENDRLKKNIEELNNISDASESVATLVNSIIQSVRF